MTEKKGAAPAAPFFAFRGLRGPVGDVAPEARPTLRFRVVTAALAVPCAVLGLLVGSFLNVVIHRVPRKESVVHPRSRCPSCGTQLKARDNVPVLSWLVLGGKCRTCRAPISARYPLVELLTGAMFAATAIRFHDSWVLPAFLL